MSFHRMIALFKALSRILYVQLMGNGFLFEYRKVDLQTSVYYDTGLSKFTPVLYQIF